MSGAQAALWSGFSRCRAGSKVREASAAVAHGLSSCCSWALEHRLPSCGSWCSCSSACGIFLDQRPNRCLLLWQADSLPLNHQGIPLPSQIFLSISGLNADNSGDLKNSVTLKWKDSQALKDYMRHPRIDLNTDIGWFH